jgi:FkbM family methyltransferase
VSRLRALSWDLLRRVRSHVTVTTRQGRFRLPLRDEAISKALFIERQYELDLVTRSLAALRSIGRLPARGQGTVLDIGANNGVISIGMLTTGEMAAAIAIEPEPGNFALLESNVKLNGLDGRMTCIRSALSDREGEVAFELSGDNFGDHRVRATAPVTGPEHYGESGRRVTKVPARRLDDALTESQRRGLSLIWMDVQGYEAHVLRGAPRVIATTVPLVTEIWPYGLRRAGTSNATFCDVAASHWATFSELPDLEPRPVAELPALLDRLSGDEDYTNVVFL